MSDDNWDAFISYASEDGLAYALELKEQFEHEKVRYIVLINGDSSFQILQQMRFGCLRSASAKLTLPLFVRVMKGLFTFTDIEFHDTKI